MAVLLADIGGTHARFRWLKNGKIGSLFNYICDDFNTPYALIDQLMKDHSEEITGIILAGAGPVKNDSLRWTNRQDWLVSKKNLQKKYRIRNVLIINDVQAQGEGLTTLYKSAKTALLTAGTGLGGCFIINNRVIPIEIGQVKTEHGKIEELISGSGIVRLYHLFGGNKKIKSATLIDVLRLQKDKAAQKAYHTFYQKWGEICGRLTTMLYAEKGICLWGNLIPKDEKDRKVLMMAYRKFLHKNLQKTPLHLVKDKTLAFKGLALLSVREFDQS